MNNQQFISFVRANKKNFEEKFNNLMLKDYDIYNEKFMPKLQEFCEKYKYLGQKVEELYFEFNDINHPLKFDVFNLEYPIQKLSNFVLLESNRNQKVINNLLECIRADYSQLFLLNSN